MSYSVTPREAPIGLKVLAAMVALDGLTSLVNALTSIGFLPAAVFFTVVGLAQLLVGVGLWKLEPTAYGLGMASFLLSALSDLLVGNVYGAGLSAVNAYVLYNYRRFYR